MHNWLPRLLDLLASQPVVIVTVIATEGSTPREVGARMLVCGDKTDGSIGGGQLEFQETAFARTLIDASAAPMPWDRHVRRVVLGPDAGQCCGGVVDVLHEVIRPRDAPILAALVGQPALTRAVRAGTAPCRVDVHSDIVVTGQHDDRTVTERLSPSLTPLHLYGAGHVARALVHVLRGLPFALTWIDVDRHRFPSHIAACIDRVVTATPVERVQLAPENSAHLIMTHSHDLDFDICRAALARDDLAFVGLIGSATKRARFIQRLGREGISTAATQRLVCPIGVPEIHGKAPEVIAVAVAAQLLTLQPAFSLKKS